MVAIMITSGDFWHHKAINRTFVFECAIGFALIGIKPSFRSFLISNAYSKADAQALLTLYKVSPSSKSNGVFLLCELDLLVR